jgi:hypothetical protein
VSHAGRGERARLAGDAEQGAWSRVERSRVERVVREARNASRAERVVRKTASLRYMSSNTPPQSQLVEPTQRLDRKSSNNAVGRPLVNISAN